MNELKNLPHSKEKNITRVQWQPTEWGTKNISNYTTGKGFRMYKKPLQNQSLKTMCPPVSKCDRKLTVPNEDQ